MDTLRTQLAQALGDAASRSGVFSETAGKIFGVLYLSAGPLSLDEIAREVGTSKGNASVQVRELLELGMVRKVWVRRSRRDYYEAVTDLWSIAAQVIGRRLQVEAQTLLRAVEVVEPELASETDAVDLVRTRVTSMRLFLQMVIALLEGFRQGEVMSPEGLRKVAG